MEVVVKEMSHLFQFFPDEVQPLQYPSHQDLVDQTGDLEINEPCSRIYFNDPINVIPTAYDFDVRPPQVQRSENGLCSCRLRELSISYRG